MREASILTGQGEHRQDREDAEGCDEDAAILLGPVPDDVLATGLVHLQRDPPERHQHDAQSRVGDAQSADLWLDVRAEPHHLGGAQGEHEDDEVADEEAAGVSAPPGGRVDLKLCGPGVDDARKR